MVQKRLQNRNITYKKILTQVDFDLSQNEVVALMGCNGSGKSTLARLLTGMLPPTQGDISLYEDGEKVPWSDRFRWQEVALVGQHPRRQTIGATVAEELGFGLVNLGLSTQVVKDKVLEFAERIGLQEQLNQSPATLSGGERQRLVLAAILLIQPSFLILDESLSMLDGKAQEAMIQLLTDTPTQQEASHPKRGQLWITHDPHLAERADRILLLKDGIMIDAGSPRDVLSRSSLCREYGIRCDRPSIVYSGSEFKDTQQDKKIKPEVLRWQEALYENGVALTQAVRQGEFIAIVGPSGAGKSTVLEGALGLRLPVQGDFIRANQPTRSGQINRSIQLLQQEAGEYLIGRTVYDEVFYRFSKKERAENTQLHQEYIRGFGIPKEKISASPEWLSGGERQRVALAAALESAPEVLLLDEPLLGLDARGREDFLARLKELKKGRTILYVTHDLGEVLEFTDRIWLIEKGKVSVDCSVQEIDDYTDELKAEGVMF